MIKTTLLPQGKPSRGGSVALFLPYFSDWFTTAFLVKAGGYEANPYLRGATLSELLLLKIGVLPVILGLIMLAGKIDRRFRLSLVIGLISWFSGLTLWNVYLLVQT